GHPLQQLDTTLGTGLLAAAEADDDLDLVASVEELLDVAALGLVVVGVDLQAHPDLLLDRVRLVLARFTGLQVGFVLVLAVIHETGDRRVRAGRDLDQVEICFLGETQGVLDPDLADLLAGGPDQEDLGDPDLTVDALFADVGSSPCVESEDDESPRMSCGGPKVHAPRRRSDIAARSPRGEARLR